MGSVDGAVLKDFGVECSSGFNVRHVSLILAIFVTSCASRNTEKNFGIPSACVTVTNAINHEDVATLQKLVKPGMLANGYPSWFRSATNRDIRAARPTIDYYVGRFLIMQDKVGTDGRTNKVYSFELVNKDGTVNPHWLQVVIGEEHGRSELVDFWNFGW